MLFCINTGFSGLKPPTCFSQNLKILKIYLRLVVTFFLNLLRLHLIEHISLGFNIYHLRL